MKNLVYNTVGRAREYSPLAFEIYDGCDHACEYCFTQKKGNDVRNVKQIPDLVKSLENELKVTKPTKQILLSFGCDPYCNYNNICGDTGKVIKVFAENNCKVAVLSKGGARCGGDIQLFKSMGKNFKYGTTLTFLDEEKSLRIEPNAATPKNRIATLEILKENDIKTFVSFEPVIEPKETIAVLKECLPFVDQFKIGKINYFEDKYQTVDWTKFLYEIVDILRSNNKQFYIKWSLQEFDTESILTAVEKDMDALSL